MGPGAGARTGFVTRFRRAQLLVLGVGGACALFVGCSSSLVTLGERGTGSGEAGSDAETGGGGNAGTEAAAERRKKAGAAARRKKAGAAERWKKAGAAERRKKAGAAERRKKAGAAERRKKAGAAERRKKAGAAERRKKVGAVVMWWGHGGHRGELGNRWRTHLCRCDAAGRCHVRLQGR
jgi:hypothetical protein